MPRGLLHNKLLSVSRRCSFGEVVAVTVFQISWSNRSNEPSADKTKAKIQHAINIHTNFQV